MLKDTQKIKQNALERKISVNVELIEELNNKRIQLSKELVHLNTQRKTLTTEISALQESKSKRKEIMKTLSEIEDQLLTEISTLPNWSADESPVEDNQIIKKSQFDHVVRADHMDICKKFDLVDFEGPAKTTGAHFYALKGVTALMEMALTSWAMNRAIQRGFLPISAPDCVRERFVVGCGFQPRRAGKQGGSLPVYTINEPEKSDDPLVLAGTSEIYLASQHSGQTLKSLPLKYVGVSHCFRSEVGHHTAASRGLYRVHQFTKIELFVLCPADSSASHFDEITKLQGDLLTELKLPFRVLEMARWELGAAANRKWDHEVWMPGRNIWGEVMSTSNCTDYQSRRLGIRYRDQSGKELVFPHTLNGTACAVPRIIMALLEWGWDPKEPELLNLPIALEPFYPSTQRKHNNLTIKFV